MKLAEKYWLRCAHVSAVRYEATPDSKNVQLLPLQIDAGPVTMDGPRQTGKHMQINNHIFELSTCFLVPTSSNSTFRREKSIY